MRKKKCAKCGKIFETARYTQTQCDECLQTGKSNVIKQRVCKICGVTFDGYPRSYYCPECRIAQEKACAARYRKRGAARPLGSIDHCAICGKEYVVSSGLQKYCPDCAADAIRKKDNAASRAWNKENGYYAKRTERPRSGFKVCVVCGKEFASKTAFVTCSPECAKIRQKENMRRRDAKRAERKRAEKNRLAQDEKAEK